MKISDIKFYHSVKVGNEEVQSAHDRKVLQRTEAYDIELTGNLIKISCNGNETYSNLNNVIWFKEKKDARNDSVKGNKLPEAVVGSTAGKSRRP